MLSYRRVGEAIKVGREHRADYELVHKIYVRMGKARMKQGDLEGALEEFNNAQVEHRRQGHGAISQKPGDGHQEEEAGGAHRPGEGS